MSSNKDRHPSHHPIMEKDKETVYKLKERNDLEVRKQKKELDQFETARNIKLKGYAKEEKQLQKRLLEFNTRISSLAQLESESSEEGSPLVVRKCKGDQDTPKGRETLSPRPVKEKPRLKITLQDLKGKKSTREDSRGMSPRSITGSKASPPHQLSPILGRQQATNRNLDVIRAEIATSNHYLISTPPAVRRRLMALAEKSNTSTGKSETKKSKRVAQKSSVRHSGSPSSSNENLDRSETRKVQQRPVPASPELGGSLPDITRQPKSTPQPIRASHESVQQKSLTSSQEKIELADIKQEAARPPSTDGRKDTAARVEEWLSKVNITSKSASLGDIASGEKSFPEKNLEPPKTAGAGLQHKHIQPEVLSASFDNLVTASKEDESGPEWLGEETDFDPQGVYSPGVPAEGGRARFFIHPSTCDEMKPSNVVDRIESTTGKSGIKSWLGMSDDNKAKVSPLAKDDKKTAGAKSRMTPPDWTM
ncbi:uncharacterized protein LOC118425383 [Branchiostoma floridae]|uniref:Uncharacterized protein LOC118425383 n=1 Tax=Branchiostoma floridae TaxID=7739 RepID=A0A9J7LVW1_BRAFL|nr:uncharacterized protein LOC118425383 [Branchiostoma floridae]XP_035690094.1 uncharacterized protein LOC118425383 [Branchiostoma floridae]